MKHIKLFILFLFAALSSSGQTVDNIIRSIDSLAHLLENQTGENRVKSLLAISEAYGLISNDKSIKIGIEAATESQKNGFHDLTARIYKSMAFTARQSGDYELSDEFFNKSLEAYQLSGNELQKAYIINNLAYNLLERSITDQAVIKFQEALDLANYYKDDTLRLLINLNLGKIHYNNLEFSKAHDILQETILIANKLEDDHSLAKARQNLAMIHWQWDENDLALNILRETIPVFEKHQNDENLSMIYNNIGLIFLHDKKLPDSSFSYFEKAKKIREAKGWAVPLANVLVNMAVAKSIEKNFYEAKELLQKSMEIYTKSGVNEGIVRTHFQLGEVYHQLNLYQLSNEHLSASLVAGNPFGIEQYNMEIIDLMLNNYEKLNDFKGFLKTYRIFKSEYDSLSAQYQQLQSAEANWKTENASLHERNQNQIAMLDKMRQQLKKQQYILGAIGASILVTIISVLVFFISRKKSTPQKFPEKGQYLPSDINL